jgi:hypothetical protein
MHNKNNRVEDLAKLSSFSSAAFKSLAAISCFSLCIHQKFSHMLSTMVRMIFKLCFQDIGNEFIDTVCWNIYNAGQCKISCAYLDSA